jgi:CHASE2 domain-containing sensor protein
MKKTSLVIPAIIILITLVGSRQIKEFGYPDWFALDIFMRLHPAEEMDTRVVIVSIDEEDIKNEPSKIISHEKVAKAINKIVSSGSAVVGVDIAHDGKIATELVNAYKENDNVIGTSKVFLPDKVDPPNGLPSERVGFVDYESDLDGLDRRASLADFSTESTRYSFAFQNAKIYLQKHHKKIDVKPNFLRLDNKIIYPLTSAFQKQKIDTSDNFQTIINYRQVHPSFHTISFRDILSDSSEALQRKIRGKVVLIGYTAITKHDFIRTSVVPTNELNGTIYGVEYHAHIISQIISTVMDNRNFIQPVSLIVECLWILSISLLSLIIFCRIPKLLEYWQLTICGLIALVFLTYAFMIFAFFIGWWIPVGATSISLTGVFTLVANIKNRRDKSIVKERLKNEKSLQRDEAYEEYSGAIHSRTQGDLKELLRSVKDFNLEIEEEVQDSLNVKKKLGEIIIDIEKIDASIKNIKEDLDNKKDPNTFICVDGFTVELGESLEQIFSIVFKHTVQYYSSLDKAKKIHGFDKINNENMSYRLKRSLCIFLENRLINVNQHAKEFDSIQVQGKCIRGKSRYRLTVEDNGKMVEDRTRIGEGTKQAEKLKDRLDGTYKEISKQSGGVKCVLEWPIL